MVKSFIFWFLRAFAQLLSLKGQLFLTKFIGRFVYEINQIPYGSFATFHMRPKKSDDVATDSIWKKLDSDTCILIQGPIVHVDEFTVETVKLYRRLYPSVCIILSIWASDEKHVKSIKDICHVLTSDLPSTSGSHNLNLQKRTTFAGIKYAEQLKYKFLLKTRCDQRFYGVDVLGYLRSLIKIFPVNNLGENSAQGRIVELSISTCKYRPWSMCDMFQFGHLSDLKRMWDFPDDPRSRSAAEYASKPYRVIDLVKENVAEIMIHRNYAKSLGLSDAIDYRSYYEFIKNQFIIIDKESIDLFWNKYSAQEYGWASHPLYSKNQLLARLTHSDWMTLFSSELALLDFESFADRLYKFEIN